MSSIAYIRMQVDIRLRQADTRNRTFNTVEVDEALRRKYIAKMASMPPPHVAEVAPWTISAGGDTFTVTLAGTTFSDALDIRIQLQSTGYYLRKATPDEMNTFWRGVSPLILGVPSRYALWEDRSGVVKGRVYPGARDAQVVNVYRSQSHTLPTSATDLDTAAVYLNEAACTALAADTAADLLFSMPEDELKKRRLNPAIAKEWKAEAATVLYQEAARRHDLMSSGRTQRWVG